MGPRLHKVVVLHSSRVWLPEQQNWLFSQVNHLSSEIEVHVACKEVANLDSFWVPNIHCLGTTDGSPVQSRRLDAGHPVDLSSPTLAALIDRLRPEILHSHFGREACDNMDAAAGSSTRHVVSFYGHDATAWPRRSPANRALYLTLFERATAVFCEGPAMAAQLVSLECPAEKVVVHHLGVPIESIPYRPRHWQPGTRLRVLIASSFRRKKGIPYALRALGSIIDEVDLEVTVIGDSRGEWDAREKARILDTIADCGLAERTRLLGFQPHDVLLREAYDHHIFLAPSVTAPNGDAEGGAPVVIIEMAASGMPVVSSIHCDIPEVIENGRTGWLAPEEDWNAIVAHLRWLISNPESWRTFLDAGRARMERDYDAHKQGQRLSSHYMRLVGK